MKIGQHATVALMALGLILSGCPGKRPNKACVHHDTENLIRNGSFESGENIREYWTYWNEWTNGETYGPQDGGHEGKRCFAMRSDKEGYHCGIWQEVALEPDMKYRYSAWIKAEMATNAGKVTCLYYDGYSPDNETGKKQWWGGSSKILRQSADWQYVEKEITTTSRVPETVNFFPWLSYGVTRIWVDDVRLTEIEFAGERGATVEKIIMKQTNGWDVTADEGKRYGIRSTCARIKAVNKDGRDSLRLNYRFRTKQHDDVILSKTANVTTADVVGVTVYGNGSGHELFMILEDRNGENHYLRLTPIWWTGWKTIYRSIERFYQRNKYAVEATHWCGDSNQAMDPPITRISVGLNDKPDAYQGSGNIWFEKIEFFSKRKGQSREKKEGKK